MKLNLCMLFSLAIIVSCGCRSNEPNTSSITQGSLFPEQSYQSLIAEEPADGYDFSNQIFDAGPLKEFNFNQPGNFSRLTLDECINSALQNSDVIRDLGGTILRTPDLMTTSSDPAIAYSDPNFGEEAALSAFDAQLTNQLLYQKNDRVFNSTFVGDLGRLSQDLMTNNFGIAKQSATGAQYRLNSQMVYDRNNTPSNRFTNDTAYDTFLEAEIRQPLLQGAGVAFNRIAGPNNLPGVNTGVLVARANTDISLAEFEIGVRDLVSDVENAYWDLYFAYRDLEAKIEARNGAYKIWERTENQEGSKNATETGQAKEQYYRFAGEVQDAIHGRLNDGTRTNNGSGSGTFRANGGVRVAERRLRLVSGLPLNDAQLIVPAEMPVDAKVVFEWTQSKDDALIHRTELRRQRWVIKRETLEYSANKNHLLPRVDLVSRYRVRGFGNDLYGDDGFNPTLGAVNQDNTDALKTMLQGDLQEWEMGIDVNVPIGFRRQNAAVRNSQLSIYRERAILKEQERQIIYGLSNSMGELERTTGLLDVNRKRLDASQDQYKAIQEDYKNDKTTIDLVLESQRRVIEAKRQYFQTQVEFMLAVKSVHFEKGTLLNFHNVSLTENGWENDEYAQAMRRESMKSQPINYYIPGMHVGNPQSEGVMAFNEFSTQEVIEFSDNEKPKSELRLADAQRYLENIDPETESRPLFSMAMQIDNEEKQQAEEETKRPFKSFLNKFASKPTTEETTEENFNLLLGENRANPVGQNFAAKGSRQSLPSAKSSNIGQTADQGYARQPSQGQSNQPLAASMNTSVLPVGTQQTPAKMGFSQKQGVTTSLSDRSGNPVTSSIPSTRFSDQPFKLTGGNVGEPSSNATFQRLGDSNITRLGGPDVEQSSQKAIHFSDLGMPLNSGQLKQTRHLDSTSSNRNYFRPNPSQAKPLPKPADSAAVNNADSATLKTPSPAVKNTLTDNNKLPVSTLPKPVPSSSRAPYSTTNGKPFMTLSSPPKSSPPESTKPDSGPTATKTADNPVSEMPAKAATPPIDASDKSGSSRRIPR